MLLSLVKLGPVFCITLNPNTNNQKLSLKLYFAFWWDWLIIVVTIIYQIKWLNKIASPAPIWPIFVPAVLYGQTITEPFTGLLVKGNSFECWVMTTSQHILALHWTQFILVKTIPATGQCTSVQWVVQSLSIRSLAKNGSRALWLCNYLCSNLHVFHLLNALGRTRKKQCWRMGYKMLYCPMRNTKQDRMSLVTKAN